MKLGEQPTRSGLADLLDLARKILPDAGELGQLRPALQYAGEVVWKVAHGARCIAVCTHTERVLALDFQEFGDLIEHRRDVGIGDGHLAYRCPDTLARQS